MQKSIIIGILSIVAIFSAGITTATIQAQTTNPGLNDLLGRAQEIIQNPSGIPGQGPEQQYQVPSNNPYGGQQQQNQPYPYQQQQGGVGGGASWGPGQIAYVDQQWDPPQSPQGAFDKCTEMAGNAGLDAMGYCNQLSQSCAGLQFSFIECYAANMVPPDQVPQELQQIIVQKMQGQQQQQQYGGGMGGGGGGFPQ